MKNLPIQVKHVIPITVLAFVLPLATASVDRVMAHASESEMEGHCRIAAAAQYATLPSYVMIARPVQTENGGTTISGSVGGSGSDPIPFTCNYDADGSFENIS